uniref:Uncharacterized protein n=1 Tax=Mycena chlorophos TaxID=658473 RepID=A0ABQ0M877_MYCCL|nr:predicted protein [Mycena chlorophos]
MEEDSALAMACLRRQFKLMSFPAPPIPIPTKSKRTKFVDADALYNAVAAGQRLRNVADLDFSGTFAIIAKPDVDNGRRAKIVARDLKRATLSPYNVDEGTPKQSSGATRRYTIVLKCTCHTGRQMVRIKSNDLFAYFASKSGKPRPSAPSASQETLTALSQSASGPACTGETIISAEDDLSHPRGVLAHRIKVSVKHPKV